MRALIPIAAIIWGAAVQAQIPAQRISAESAQKIVAGCVARDAAQNQSHSIAVTDTGGQLVAVLRMDTRSPGATEFAIEKARASALWGFATSGMEEGARGTPGFADAPHVVTVAGGVPVYNVAQFVLTAELGRPYALLEI